MHVNICDSNSGRTTAGSHECEKLRIYHRHLLSVLVLRGDDSAALPMLRLVIGPVHCPMYRDGTFSQWPPMCVCVCVWTCCTYRADEGKCVVEWSCPCPVDFKILGDTLLRAVRRTRLSTVGDRAYPVAASWLWNTLPQNVTSAPSLTGFRKRLKTYLLNRSLSRNLL